ncbi:MAG: DNA gyrase inhibitor YacG [Candidatus Dadabacteria bacterium]
MQVKCPRCGKLVKWEGNKWKPFCSERCKLIDLGAWVGEEYKIPEEPVSEENQKQINGRNEEE